MRKIFLYVWSLILFFNISVSAQGSEEYYQTIRIADSLRLLKRYKEASKLYSKAFKLNNNKALVNHRYAAAQCWGMQSNLDSAFYNLFKIAKFKTEYNSDVISSDIHFNSLKSDKRWDSLIAILSYKESKFNSVLSKTLDSVLYLDQKSRSDFFLLREKYAINSLEYNTLLKKMHEVDSTNQLIVLDIINKYGWLGEDVVGVNGNMALFLVIQHSNTDVQEKMLPILKAAVKDKKAKANELALLEDRISVARTGKQIYGSQYFEQNAIRKLYPIIDPVNVNNRRYKMGLGSLEDYLKMSDIQYTE